MEEAEEGVDVRGESSAEIRGDAAEEVSHHVGVLIERLLHLIHYAPEHRRCRRGGGGTGVAGVGKKAAAAEKEESADQGL
ncbi:hypothetical protein ABZP36_027103 [Zizania latifolia]